MAGKKKESTRFIKSGMARVKSVCNHLGPKEFLRSKLAPHCICNSEDGVYLSWTRGLPFVDQGRK